MSDNSSKLPENQKLVKFLHIIKSPGTPGVAYVENFSDVLPKCKELAFSLSCTRDTLEDQGELEVAKKLHFNKKNFNKFIFGIEFDVNGNTYHVNLAVFNIKDKNFGNKIFATALKNYFDENSFNTVHFEVIGCNTHKDGKEYHHFEILFHKRKVWDIEINQFEAFNKLHKAGLDGFRQFKPIFGTLRFNNMTPQQDYQMLRKHFQI